MVDKMKRLKFWCQPVLPLTYDDSLSYLETLSKVINKVNEVISYAENILQTAEDYTDAEVAALNTVLEGEITELQHDMEQFKIDVYQYVDNEQDEFEEEMRHLFEAQREAIENEFATLTTQVNNLISALSNTVETLRTYVDTQDETIKKSIRDYYGLAIEYVDNQVEIIEQEIQAIVLESVTKVIDPCDTEVKSLQDTLDNMYYNLRSWAFTARQYDMLGLTASEYDEVQGCAWTYDYLGKWVWWQKPEIYKYINSLWERMQKALEKVYKLIDERTITHSAWKGSEDKIIHILDSAIQEIRVEGIEAELYDSLALSCTDYSSYDMTAYVYDWHAKKILFDPSEDEFAMYAQMELETAYATNNLLDAIVSGIGSVDVTDGVLTVVTQPFDGEPYDVQGILSDTIPRLAYQVYTNIVAVNQIIEQNKYQFEYNDGVLDVVPIGISKIPETINTNFNAIVNQIMRVRNVLNQLNDYYTYVMSIENAIYSITGTKLVVNL